MQHCFSRQCLDAKGELHTNVDLTGHLDHLRELNRLFSGVLQVLNREDLESRVVDLYKLAKLSHSAWVKTYQLVCLLHVGTLQSGHDRGAQSHLLNNVDQSLGNGIAADNTTKDVDENARNLRVVGDQLECGLDGSGRSTTTNIEEVGGATAVELDNIHSGHGESSTVDCLS